MRSLVSCLLLVVVIAFSSTQALDAAVSSNPAYVCSFCLVLFGLVEESIYQVHLETFLQSKCKSDVCRTAVQNVILQAEAGWVPEQICRNIQLCTDTCDLFVEWPVNPIPAKPVDWPIERRRLATSLSSHDGEKAQAKIDYSDLRTVMTEFVSNVMPNTPEAHERVPAIGVISAALAQVRGFKLETDYEPCGHNVTCHIINFADGHLPLKDADGDRFAPKEAKRFRGSDWRGYDCDDRVRCSCFYIVLFFNCV
jgi:hypothetical protein